MPFEAKATETKANLVVQIRRGLNMSHEGVLKKMNVQLKDLFIRLLEPDKGLSSFLTISPLSDTLSDSYQHRVDTLEKVPLKSGRIQHPQKEIRIEIFTNTLGNSAPS